MLFMTKQEKEKQLQTLESMTRKRSQGRDVLGRLIRNKLGSAGLLIVLILLVLIVFAGLFTKHSYQAQDFDSRFLYPSSEHIMGTDNLGRDIWARLIYGGRVSMMVALLALFISYGIGLVIGAVAGYFGGATDLVVTRVIDIIMALPGLLLAIAVAATLGPGPVNTALAISISGIPIGARITRATIIAIKGNEFVEAARATGSGHMKTIFKHILPNTIAPLLVSATLTIGGNIMAISSLSFIGLGVAPPTPEWGSILAAGRSYIRDFYPIVVFPSLFIVLTLFGFNLFGDALRDALDPRLKD